MWQKEGEDQIIILESPSPYDFNNYKIFFEGKVEKNMYNSFCIFSSENRLKGIGGGNDKFYTCTLENGYVTEYNLSIVSPGELDSLASLVHREGFYYVYYRKNTGIQKRKIRVSRSRDLSFDSKVFTIINLPDYVYCGNIVYTNNKFYGFFMTYKLEDSPNKYKKTG